MAYYNDLQTASQLPQLEIIEEPRPEFRFRYQTEVRAAYGCLHGIDSNPERKSYPTVRLKNFYEPAIIRCTLGIVDSVNKSIHPHKLIVKSRFAFQSDPHLIDVLPEVGFQAVFKGLCIMNTPRKNMFDQLIEKKIMLREFEKGAGLSDAEQSDIKRETQFEYKIIDLNRVCLCFEAFYKRKNDVGYTRICDPVYSHIINNLKSSNTGELRISRLSHISSEARGGQSLILLVEKISCKNIKVRFYEENDLGDITWEAWGQFSASDVHRQYAIICTTPPYYKQDIQTSVLVFIQLYRPSDDAVSDPRQFFYVPNLKNKPDDEKV